MGRKRKELLSSAPWRTGEAAEDEDAARMSREGKVSVTSNPGETPTMSMPRSKRQDLDLTVDDFEEDEIDPELRYSFQRNSRFLKRVFSVDTLVKPLPPVMAYSVSRNINFFFRIFTQFWDEEGIANAQKSLGLGNEDAPAECADRGQTKFSVPGSELFCPRHWRRVIRLERHGMGHF
uniref:Uncharacterized protein n=1 Tax=Zea mays TaxID=4577 RepID=B6TC10_MAIZE|nr:hypothetical protein [Zea mays]